MTVTDATDSIATDSIDADTDTELPRLLDRFLADLGATAAAGNIVIGDRPACIGPWPRPAH